MQQEADDLLLCSNLFGHAVYMERLFVRMESTVFSRFWQWPHRFPLSSAPCGHAWHRKVLWAGQCPPVAAPGIRRCCGLDSVPLWPRLASEGVVGWTVSPCGHAWHRKVLWAGQCLPVASSGIRGRCGLGHVLLWPHLASEGIVGWAVLKEYVHW